MNERVGVLLCSSPAAPALHGELAKKKKKVLLTIKGSKSDSGSFAAESLSKNARGKKKRKGKTGQGALIAQHLSFFSEKCPGSLEFENLSVS